MRTLLFIILLLAGTAVLAEDSLATPAAPPQLSATNSGPNDENGPAGGNRWQRLRRWLRNHRNRCKEDGGGGGNNPTPGPLPLALLGLGALGVGFGLRRRRDEDEIS